MILERLQRWDLLISFSEFSQKRNMHMKNFQRVSDIIILPFTAFP